MRTLQCLLLFILLGTSLPVRAQGLPIPSPASTAGDPLRDVGFEQNLGEVVPADLQLIDENGTSQSFHDLLGGKPAILDLGYYGCPMLCGQVRTGLCDSLKGMDWTLGQQYRVLTVSIDPRERSDVASRYKARTMSRYDRTVDPNGWRFLVGTPAEIVRLTGAVGFKAVYDRRTDQFAHPAGGGDFNCPGQNLVLSFWN